MHFIKESFHRKPLESKTLVYSRGATAILLGLSFIGYCVYLILQTIHSQPLLQLSTKYFDRNEQLPMPTVEICSFNSTITIVTCKINYKYYRDSIYAPNCQKEFLVHSPATATEDSCYTMELNKPLNMTSEIPYSNQRLYHNVTSPNLMEDIVVYWKIDDILNASYVSLPSIPSINLRLFDASLAPKISFIYLRNYVQHGTLTSLETEKIYSLMNHSMSIYYHPEKYRVESSKELSYLHGTRPDYLDITRYVAKGTNMPLDLNPPFESVNRELYHGLFSLNYDNANIDIKTEIMQHTVLSSIALAGGGYSVLTGIYVVLFGMSKVSPWGAVHVIPMYVRRKHQSKKTDEENEDTINEEIENNSDLKESKRLSSDSGSFLRILGGKNLFGMKSNLDKIISSQDPLEMTDPYRKKSIKLVKSTSQQDLPLLSHHAGTKESNVVISLPDNDIEASGEKKTINISQENEEIIKLRKETAMLSTRMKEMEVILSEYFIDTKYLDHLRFKKKALSSSNDPELLFN